MSTTTILISLAVIATDLPTIDLTPGEVGVAPRILEHGIELPMSQSAPLHGFWSVTENGKVVETIRAGAFLPYPLNVDIERRLRLLQRYPDLCQHEIDKYGEALDLKYRKELDVVVTEAIVNRIDDQIDRDSGNGYVRTVLLVLGAAIVFGSAGYGIGALTRK